MSFVAVSEHRQTTSPKWLLILFLTLALLSVAAFVVNLAVTASQSSAAPVVENAPQAAAAAPVYADAGDQLTVWVGTGPAPGQHSASEPGQVVLMDGTGVFEPIIDVPPQTTRVQACSEAPTSPDGQNFAFFIGLEAGNLYLKKGADAPTVVDEVSALACLGSGTFRYSPDSTRMAYIDYEPGAEQSEFADGFLKVVSTADLSQQFSYENVVAFDIHNDLVAFVSFFTNDKNEADEAAVLIWNGSGTLEVATLTPTAEDCKFTSASVAVLPDSKLMLVMGHRCTSGDTRTAWQLYQVDPSNRSATLAASDFQDGQYASFARTNSIFLSPDGARAYFGVADGITANTAGLKMVTLADLALTDLIDRQVVMATYSGAANAFPRVSPDGKWLALVVTSPNNENELQLWNMADPSVAPITISAGSQGDTISSMAFSPDSSRLFLVAGGDSSANNSLIGVELTNGTDFRVSRGRFGAGLTVSPSGAEIAILDWQVLEDPNEPPYANLVVIGVDSGQTATLFTGAEIVDGKVTNQQFAFPMRWVRP